MKHRLRGACVCVREGCLLLVCHRKPDQLQPYWIPPGGGVRPGETLLEAVVREVREETGLIAQPSGLLGMRHVFEADEAGFEFFLAAQITGGRLGAEEAHPVLCAVQWVPLRECSERLIYPRTVVQWAQDLAHYTVPLEQVWMAPLELAPRLSGLQQ